MFKNLARSPLLHFLIIGAAIYGIYGLAAPKTETDDSTTLVVTAGDIAWLVDSFSTRWNRPPMPAERQGLIDQFIRESVLYREAVEMGLDRDDVIIRRRLAQKLEFLFNDLADATPPTEEELRAHFEAHADAYQDPDTLTFTNVFVDPDRRGDETLTDAAKILASLEELEVITDADEYGDPFMLQSYYPERSESEVARLFGQEFARSIFELAPGRWHGPVLSGYGVHLVYVHGRTESPAPTFDIVRERVAESWQTMKRGEFNDEFVARLMDRYTIIIEDVAPEERAPTR